LNKLPQSVARFDVAIVGGGPAGLATAIALKRLGTSAIVFERTDYRSPRVGEHIPPGTKAALAALGLKDALSSGQHAYCPGIRSVWGDNQPTDRDYLLHPHGDGINLTRPDFDMSLAALARELGAVVLTDARITRLSRDGGSWTVSAEHGGSRTEARCSIVIDAGGRAAPIAKRLGARPIVYDDLIGIFAKVAAAARRNNLVVIEAVPDGWWYSAGLADGGIIATFLTDAGLVNTSTAARSRTWKAQLKAASMTSARIASPDQPGELHVRTARTQRLDRVAGDGWLAVGDAAMSFDPLSSEGISKGLEWGAKAAVVAIALCQGDHSAVRSYRDDIGKTFAAYLVTRYSYYAAEKRWPDAMFWRRRRYPPRPIDADQFAADGQSG
jgi:flavin-dependent dehydrogenase